MLIPVDFAITKLALVRTPDCYRQGSMTAVCGSIFLGPMLPRGNALDRSAASK